MPASDPIAAYLQLANDLFEGRITETELASAATDLPSLDKNLLDQLAQSTESFSMTQPRYGWAISRVAQQAAVSQDNDLLLQSLAAWNLARACNQWSQPKRVQEAVTLARGGFGLLNEAGWLAACDWQENALAWTKPNFTEAVQALKDALHGLESRGLTQFMPECRLSLAYAQILIGEHAEAMRNIQLSEEVYGMRGDDINQARCWLNQASSLRRQDHFEEAHQKLEQALAVFERRNSITDQAKARYQMALGHLLQLDDLSQAVAQFKKAANLFESTELDLWEGMCINSLGSVYLFTGELTLADKYYQQAEEIFARHEILGLLADNFNDHGEVNILRGRSQASIEQYKQSIAINEKLGSHLSAAIVTTNLGKAYGQNGRYQDALFYLERAAEQLEVTHSHMRLGTCEKYMALLWSRLGQPAMAHKYLDRSAAHYEMAGQKALLADTSNYRASAFFQQGRHHQAIEALEQSLHIAESIGIRPQAALAKYLLGEALLQTDRRDEGLRHLEQARSDFADMGMTPELAACLISLGSYRVSNSEPERARSAFEEALQLSGKTLPEIDWRGNIELGHLAEPQGNIESAIEFYRLGMDAFGQIHHNFLQPALAGSYAQAPARTFDRVITVTSKADPASDTLRFIEQTKASTLLRSLAHGNSFLRDSTTQELDDLKAEIDLLRNELRTSFEGANTLQSALGSRKLREQLKNKIAQYDDSKASLERKGLPNGSPVLFPHVFNPDIFRTKATTLLAENWIALEYYITEGDLITVMVSPHECQVFSGVLSNRFWMALDACDQARRNARPPLQSDMEILGRHLIPASVMDTLTPDTVLLIAPHRRLHQVPWAALLPESATQPLVCLCTPCVVPSLQSLMLLWGRKESTQKKDRSNGLLVGLSSFQGRYDELPMVREEVSALASTAGADVQLFEEENATWENLMASRASEDWSRFAWLHVATHFSSDRHTGRVSRIALHGGDIWLDQLRDLSPLPELVSLSACNSNDSFLYEGDERLDLQTTCLIGGAQSVIGSAWALPDQSAAELTLLFYEHYLSGLSPANAVARAQRQFIENGRDLSTWASFHCAGIP